MSNVIYLDYAATTPVDPRVAEKMNSCLLMDGTFGNPASRSHQFGWEAEEEVEWARSQVARVIGADPREIIWTSGATESDNLAIKGLAEGSSRKHIITSSIEHKAVLDPCAYLELKGFEVTYLEPGASGIISPDQVEAALRPDTLLVSLMHVNNEIGTINDIAQIAKLCHASGTMVHTDAAQSFGKIPIQVRNYGVDLLSISAHKVYGPKGIGALYVRRDPPLDLKPLIHGGGHERKMRSGTLPTHQIVGLGEASRIMLDEMTSEGEGIGELRDKLLAVLEEIPGLVLHGDREQRIPGILNVGFPGLDGETLLLALNDIAVSTGSACTSATVEPSYVLRALKVPDEIAHASIRFSIGRYTTMSDIDYVGQRVKDIVEKLQ